MNDLDVKTNAGLQQHIHLDKQVNTLAFEINEKRTIIHEKYNLNIKKELSILQNDQE